MLDVRIDRLRLHIENSAGQEHRIRPIMARAMALLADRLDARLAAGGWEPTVSTMASLGAPLVNLNLNGMSDEQAAGAVADALVRALALELGL